MTRSYILRSDKRHSDSSCSEPTQRKLGSRLVSFVFCLLSLSIFLARAGTSRSFTMSRRLRYASSHSRESSPRGDSSSLPSTEATFQDLNLAKSTTSTSRHHLTVPSSHQASASRQRQASYPPADLTAQYLHTGYEPSHYSRPSSSERLVNPRYNGAASAFGIPDSDPVDFQIDPSSLSFDLQQNISDPTLVARADMR